MVMGGSGANGLIKQRINYSHLILTTDREREGREGVKSPSTIKTGKA